MARIGPIAGGCWFCDEQDDEPMMFDTEFDTYVHERCLRMHLEPAEYEPGEPSYNPEAEIMRYLIEAQDHHYIDSVLMHHGGSCILFDAHDWIISFFPLEIYARN